MSKEPGEYMFLPCRYSQRDVTLTLNELNEALVSVRQQYKDGDWRGEFVETVLRSVGMAAFAKTCHGVITRIEKSDKLPTQQEIRAKFVAGMAENIGMTGETPDRSKGT